MARRQRTQTAERQQSANQVHPDFASAENIDGVSFSRGNMVVNGQAQQPSEVRHWESSNGLSQYATVQWVDPASGEKRVSCNCPGWAIKRKGRLRSCKHTDDMMGINACNAEPVEREPIVIKTVTQAESEIPKFEGRALRGIMLD